MIHRWSISSHPSESVARLYSNRDIALRGPDLCSSVMWLRVMIRDRIFSSLDRAVQPEFFQRWGGGESGEAEEEEGIVARMDRFLEMSRGGITSNWTGNRPIVSFHAPFYFPRRICRGEIFAEGMIFHLCLRWRRDENDSVIRCKSFNKILYTEKFRNYLGRVTSCNIFWRQSYYKRVS